MGCCSHVGVCTFDWACGSGFRKRNVDAEGVGRQTLRVFGLSLVHPTARSWDWVFHRVDPCFVLVTLKDGSQCAGYWGVNAAGTQSFASSDPKERDLYISQVFEISDEGPWRPTPKSIFIAAGEIRTVEFIQEENSSERAP